MENETEFQDLENLEEGQDSILATEEQGETIDEREERLRKAEEIARNQRMRAEKAERELKTLKASGNKKEEGLSLKDIRALQDVPDEDVDEVTDFAKFKGITIAEAKSHAVMQSLLRTRAEERASANAVATKGQKRGLSKVSDEHYLSKVQNQEDMSDDEMQQAAAAKIREWQNKAK